MASRNDINHERMRWGSMTRGQLVTRLGRIRDPQKLRNFHQLAWENNETMLIEAAIACGDTLGIELRDVRMPPGGGYRPRRHPFDVRSDDIPNEFRFPHPMAKKPKPKKVSTVRVIRL